MSGRTLSLLKDIRRDIDKLIDDIHWLDNLTRTQRRRRVPNNDTHNRGKGDASDPTGDVVASMQTARELLDDADREIRQAFVRVYKGLVPAWKTLRMVRRAIDDHEDQANRNARIDPKDETDTDEHAEAIAAKSRRESRGEGWGQA